MKKGLIAIFCLLILTFTSLPVSAQTRYRRYDSSRRYEQRSNDWRYRDGRRNSWDRDRSVWDRHRDKITTGIGAGGGAVLGAAVGGKKGAVIGALLGAGGAALYTYKLRDRDGRRYSRRYYATPNSSVTHCKMSGLVRARMRRGERVRVLTF
jgi:hypothetical protein